MSANLRTIVLQEVLSPSGGSSYWALNENGRITDQLGPDELLWAVACSLRPVGPMPYRGGQTLEEAQLSAFRQGAVCGLRGDIQAVQARGRCTVAPGGKDIVECTDREGSKAVKS